MCLLTAWARSLHTGCLLSNKLCHDALESPTIALWQTPCPLQLRGGMRILCSSN
jgi:hypothetical protein